MRISKNYILVAALAFSASLAAQSDLTLYNFNAIPQSLSTNPAQKQQAKVWIGLPVVSGVQTHYHNSGFALIDLFATGTNPNDNVDNIINSLDERSQITSNTSVDLLGVGFKVGRGFVSFGSELVVDVRTDYPADLLRFINFGNAGGVETEKVDASFKINSFDLEYEVRTNTYIGYQHMFLDDKLSVGGRFKYIIGQQSGYIDRINATITTNDTALIVDSDALVRTSGLSPFVDTTLIRPGEIDLALPGNSGYGFDLGVSYDVNERLNISASVLDIGSITWNTNNRDYVSKGQYAYTGVDVDFSNDDPAQGAEFFIDSLQSAFNFEEVDGEAYTKSLNTRIFLSVNYKLNDKHSVGALFHTRKWGGEFFNDYSVNYVGKWSRTFQFTTSYSIINGTYNNVGAGFQAKLGPVQLYVISDNVFGAVFIDQLQTTNLRVGVNITFFGKKSNNKKPTETEGIRLVEPGKPKKS